MRASRLAAAVRPCIPPIEGQTRVGHQLVGSEPRRLLPCKDRGDNIRSEKSQPHKARRIRSRDPFLVRDGLERRTVRFEHSLGDFLTTHEQSDQGRIRWRRIGDALDDELHLLAGSLQARANAEPDRSLFGAIRIRVRRSIPFDSPLACAVVQKPAHQTRRADVKVNAIRVNLCPDEDGAREFVQRLGRQMFPASAECSRRVPGPHSDAALRTGTQFIAPLLLDSLGVDDQCN